MLEALGPQHVAGCEAVIASLPEWFGYEGALADTSAAVRTQRGYVSSDGGVVNGFVTMMTVFPETIEITYLAVRAASRRSGIGRKLLGKVRDAAVDDGASHICLLTLGPSADNIAYGETVAFYRALGFLRIKEVELSSWGGAPALVMAAPVLAIG